MTKISGNLVKWGISLLVPALIWLIPLSEAYTAELRMFFMITAFIILLIAFDIFDLLVPSLLLPTLYYISGIVPLNVAYASWTNSTVWMILGALVLATVLEECGLLQRIAIWCIRKCGGSFTGALYGIFLAGCVISFITFCQAFIVMMTLTYGVCKAMKLERSNHSALMCFVGMLGGITTCTFIYNPGYLALGEAGIQAIVPGFSVQWYDSYLYNGLCFFLFLGIIYALTKFFKTHEVQFEGGAKYFDAEYEKMGPMSVKEKKALAVVVLLMCYLLTAPLHKLSPALGFMTIPYLLFCPGFKVAAPGCTKKINFSIIVFIASCLGIGVVSSALNAEKLIAASIAPVLDHADPLFALVLMLLMGAFCNLFMTPYAMMGALSMPFAALGNDIGISPLTSVMTLMISTDVIFLPHEVAGCLLMYSFGLISMGNFARIYTFKAVCTVLFFMAVLYPLWKLCGFIAA